MTAWWRALSLRERRLVLLAVVFVGIALVYLLAWRPLGGAIGRMQAQVRSMQSDLSWMRSAAQRLEANGTGGAVSAAPVGGSLLDVIDHVSGAQGTRAAMSRLSQQGTDRVRVEFKHIALDRFLHWLDALGQQGIQARSLDITPVQPGIVAVDLVLERGAPRRTSD